MMEFTIKSSWKREDLHGKMIEMLWKEMWLVMCYDYRAVDCGS